MKRLLLTIAALAALATPAAAQPDYRNTVQLTITDSSTSFTPSDLAQGNGHPQVNSASCVSDSTGGGEFRFRVDGTAPTTTMGIPVPEGGAINFVSPLALAAFKAIRTGATSAVLTCTLSSSNTPPVTPVGAGGGGGGGVGSDVNLIEVGGVAIALGQTTMAASLPVAIASNQDSLTVAQATAANLNAAVVGTLAADGVAAATNRVGTLPAVASVSGAPGGLTAGRNSALYTGLDGALFVAPTSGDFATDAVFGTTTYTETSSTGPLVGAVRTDTPAALANTTNEVAPLSSSALGGLYTASASDPCSRLAKTVIPINISTISTTEITPSLAGASNYYYVCAFEVVTAAANNVALVYDDTDGCVSVTGGMAGGATAATGWNFSANGGIARGNGLGTVYKTGAVNSVICVMTSANTQLSGVLHVVAAP